MNAMTISTNNEAIAIFNDPSLGEQYLSFTPDTQGEKIQVFNAINSPDFRLADVINKPITIKDVIVSKVKLSARVNNTGKNRDNPPAGFAPETDDKDEEGFRVILLDMEGKSYTATSRGIYNSICNLRAVFGSLHFDEGLKMVVKQIGTKNGNTLTITLE